MSVFSFAVSDDLIKDCLSILYNTCICVSTTAVKKCSSSLTSTSAGCVLCDVIVLYLTRQQTLLGIICIYSETFLCNFFR